MSAIKIGDTVAWADVPDGAMVRLAGYTDGLVVVVVKRWGCGQLVWRSDRGKWYCASPEGGVLTWSVAAPHPQRLPDNDWPVTIIALGLTGSESAENLQRMAEIFDGWRDLCERTGWDREMAWGNAVALHGFGWRAGLPFVASKFVRATEDQTKPPPGYEVEQDAGDPEVGAWGSYLRLEGETIWESAWLRERPDALAAAWAHHDASAATKEQP